MRPHPTPTTPLRRALVGFLAGATGLALLPATASAQTGGTPTTSLDALCANVPADDEFDDVSDDDSWAQAVRCLADAGITAGVGSDDYGPSRPVTRQQMASFVARMMDATLVLEDGDHLTPLPTYDGDDPFDDVRNAIGREEPHREAISRLAAAGIAQGGPGRLPASSFGPGREVSRGQMAAFIARAVGHLTGTTPTAARDHFDDDDGSVHEADINALAEAGIVQGYGDGVYRPDASVLRASMAAFLLRPLANLEADGAITPLPARPEVDAPLTAVSSSGVTVYDADGSIRHEVSSEPADAAYAVGPDLVAYTNDEPGARVRVWTPGDEEELPIAADMRSVALLDAASLDGTPTALVVEYGGGEDIEVHDSRLEVVLIDLTDGSRTTVHRLDEGAAWEFFYSSGRILPDGDVVVVGVGGDSATFSRWSPGGAEATWSVRSDWPGFEAAILEQQGAVYSVVPADSGGAEPSFTITERDAATGAALSSRTVDVAAFAAGRARWYECPDLVSADVLICNPYDRAPVAVDLATGWTRTLPGGADATVSEVRPTA